MPMRCVLYAFFRRKGAKLSILQEYVNLIAEGPLDFAGSERWICQYVTQTVP